MIKGEHLSHSSEYVTFPDSSGSRAIFWLTGLSSLPTLAPTRHDAAAS